MREIKILTACVAVLTVIAVGAVLSAAQSVFLPLVIAWLLSYILSPVVRFLTNRRIPFSLAIVVVLVILLVVALLGGSFLSSRVASFVQTFPVYYERLANIVRDVSPRVGLPADIVDLNDWGVEIRSYLLSLTRPVLTLTSKTVMVVIILVFILIGSPYTEYKVRKAFSAQSCDRVLLILASISKQIGRFLSVMTLISAFTGFCVWVALTALGVDFAATWGILAFMLNFIPTVGSIVASIPPILVAVVQFYPNTLLALAVAGALLVIQFTLGNILTPKVMGDNLNLSPVVILVSLLFWGWLWGVAGALLSMPIAAIIRIVCENVKQLNMLSVLMGSGKKFKKEFQEEQRQQA